MKLAENQAKAEHQPKAKLLPFENCLLSSSTLSSKNKRVYSKRCLCQRDYIISYIENGN